MVDQLTSRLALPSLKKTMHLLMWCNVKGLSFNYLRRDIQGIFTKQLQQWAFIPVELDFHWRPLISVLHSNICGWLCLSPECLFSSAAWEWLTCHLSANDEPHQPQSLCAVWQRNESVGIALSPPRSKCEKVRHSHSEQWHLIKWGRFFVTESRMNLSFQKERFFCRRSKDFA